MRCFLEPPCDLVGLAYERRPTWEAALEALARRGGVGAQSVQDHVARPRARPHECAVDAKERGFAVPEIYLDKSEPHAHGRVRARDVVRLCDLPGRGARGAGRVSSGCQHPLRPAQVRTKAPLCRTRTAPARRGSRRTRRTPPHPPRPPSDARGATPARFRAPQRPGAPRSAGRAPRMSRSQTSRRGGTAALTCPLSTGRGTRRVQLVRSEGRDVSS